MKIGKKFKFNKFMIINKEKMFIKKMKSTKKNFLIQQCASSTLVRMKSVNHQKMIGSNLIVTPDISKKLILLQIKQTKKKV